MGEGWWWVTVCHSQTHNYNLEMLRYWLHLNLPCIVKLGISCNYINYYHFIFITLVRFPVINNMLYCFKSNTTSLQSTTWQVDARVRHTNSKSWLMLIGVGPITWQSVLRHVTCQLVWFIIIKPILDVIFMCEINPDWSSGFSFYIR